jgi:hypothetical protein
MKMKRLMMGLLVAVSINILAEASVNLSNMEAMFVYNFLRHVNWPAAQIGDEFVIGVYGNAQIFDQLVKYTENRKVGTKAIQIRKISSESDAKSCQVVFVPASASSKIMSLRAAIGNRPTLVVGEKEGSNQSGSTIEFLIQDNKLKFRINEDRAKEQNLIFSRALMDMAV